MELFLKVLPTIEPLTLEEVRSYLRISSQQEDEVLLTLISTARAHVERITGRALLKQQWQMDLKPPYPRSSPLVQRRESNIIIHLLKLPLLGIKAVKVRGKAVSYRREENKIILPTIFMEEDIRITYWAGYGETPAAVPPDLKMSVLMAVRCLYEHQEIELPLLKPFKVLHLV